MTRREVPTGPTPRQHAGALSATARDALAVTRPAESRNLPHGPQPGVRRLLVSLAREPHADLEAGGQPRDASRRGHDRRPAPETITGFGSAADLREVRHNAADDARGGQLLASHSETQARRGPRRRRRTALQVDAVSQVEFALIGGGVTCPTCVVNIESFVEQLAEIVGVKVNFGAARVAVKFGRKRVAVAEDAIESAGHKCVRGSSPARRKPRTRRPAAVGCCLQDYQGVFEAITLNGGLGGGRAERTGRRVRPRPGCHPRTTRGQSRSSQAAPRPRR